MTTVLKLNNNLPVFNSFFDDFFRRDLHTGYAYGKIAVNVKEANDAFHLEIVAPGFKKEDFSIALDEQFLKIEAKVEADAQEAKEENYTIREYQKSSFQKAYKLPNEVDVENITAKYDGGILYVQIPRKPKDAVKTLRSINIE